MEKPIPPLALRPRDAARTFGISPRTLFTWTKEGRIPCVKIGRTVLYSVSELQAWLARQSGGALEHSRPAGEQKGAADE